MYYGTRPAVTYDPAVQAIAMDNACFSVTDLAGTYVQDAGKIRLTRSTVDGSGFEHTAPGARVRFAVVLDSPGDVEIDIDWTGLVERNDVYNAVGEIFINGTSRVTFEGPPGPADPVPTGTSMVTLPLTAGTKQIEIIFPYCASMDPTGVRIPATATVQAATARPTKRAVFIGDSITQGFNVTRSAASWPFLVAVAETAQCLDHGYGGRELSVGDATTCGAYGCDFGVVLFGANNFIANGQSTTTFKNNYKTFIANWRAASTAAGKPTAPLYALTLTYIAGGYAGNSPTAEQFRQAIRDAVSEQADAYTVLIEGASGGMPTGVGNFPDYVHPNNGASVTFAEVVAGVVA